MEAPKSSQMKAWNGSLRLLLENDRFLHTRAMLMMQRQHNYTSTASVLTNTWVDDQIVEAGILIPPSPPPIFFRCFPH